MALRQISLLIDAEVSIQGYEVNSVDRTVAVVHTPSVDSSDVAGRVERALTRAADTEAVTTTTTIGPADGAVGRPASDPEVAAAPAIEDRSPAGGAAIGPALSTIALAGLLALAGLVVGSALARYRWRRPDH